MPLLDGKPAPRVRQTCFQIQASTHLPEMRVSQPPLWDFSLFVTRREQCSPCGSLQGLYENWHVRASFDSGENNDDKQSQPHFLPSSPIILLSPPGCLYSPAPATVAPMLNSLYTPSPSKLLWFCSCPPLSLLGKCYSKDLPMAHSSHFQVSAQFPLPGRTFLMTLSNTATPPAPPGLYYMTQLYFLDSPSCYLKFYHVHIYLLIYYLFLSILCKDVTGSFWFPRIKNDNWNTVNTQ